MVEYKLDGCWDLDAGIFGRDQAIYRHKLVAEMMNMRNEAGAMDDRRSWSNTKQQVGTVKTATRVSFLVLVDLVPTGGWRGGA